MLAFCNVRPNIYRLIAAQKGLSRAVFCARYTMPKPQTGLTQQAVNSFFSARPAPKSSNTQVTPQIRPRSPQSPEGPNPKRVDIKHEPSELNSPTLSSSAKSLDDDPKSIMYSDLTDVFQEIESTTKRLEIVAYCTDFFLKVLHRNPDELSKVVYLFINRLGPDYEGLELGLGESLIIKALSESTGQPTSFIKSEYHKVGDLGTVALKSRSSQPPMFAPKPLRVMDVFKYLNDIATASGTSSQIKKLGLIRKMLTACKGNEAKYLVRSLEGKLRIGMAEKSVLTSLAQAFVAWEIEKSGTGKKVSAEEVTQSEELIKDVYCQLPNYDLILDAVIHKGGLANLRDTCKLTAGIPLKPMLAKPTKSISEVLDRFQGERFTCEYKYDGERAQIHATSDGEIRVYSRNMEDMSQRYPDIVSIVPKIILEKNVSFILDCEAVAWDRVAQKILPFQVLSTRKRKDVSVNDIKVQVHLFVFDILFFKDEPLLQKSLTERRELIRTHFNMVEGEFAMAKSMNSEDTEEIQAFLDQSMKDSCEGLMIKVLDGPESGYEPSKRSRNWLKLKKDYLTGIGDSLDLVVLGAYYGHGKRTNMYGGFLLGTYNADTEEYETVCKIGTGFSENNLEEFFKQLSETVVEEPKSYISYERATNAMPDVWFEPKYVWEVLTADLSLSPIYKAGIDELGKGVSLRFPRFVRVRDDKNPEDATTSEQIVQFYKRQASLNNE